MRKHLFLFIVFTSIFTFQLESQEIYWSNMDYDIVKYELSNDSGISEAYSLSLFEDGMIRIRMIQSGHRLFLVANNVSRFDNGHNEQYHYILRFSDGTQRDIEFYSSEDGFNYLVDYLSRIDGVKLGDVYYHHHYIATVLDTEEIQNLDLLQVISNINGEINFYMRDRDYARHCRRFGSGIHLRARIGFRNWW